MAGPDQHCPWVDHAFTGQETARGAVARAYANNMVSAFKQSSIMYLIYSHNKPITELYCSLVAFTYIHRSSFMTRCVLMVPRHFERTHSRELW